MRRLLLTLLAAAVAAPQELRRTNPWLSACDVTAEPPAPPAPSAPVLPRALCALPPAERERALRDTRLRHCRERALGEALEPAALGHALGGGARCERALGDLTAVDDMAARASRDLASILARYDCAQPFSVIHTCEDCQEAYRRWVCSSLLPLFVSAASLEFTQGATAPHSASGASPETGWSGARGPGATWEGRPPAPPPRKRSTSRDNYKLYASNNKNTKLKNDNLNYELGDKDEFGADYFETFYYSASRNITRGLLSNESEGGVVWGEGFVTGRPWNEKVHGRPEQRVVETKKDLDNRLGARRPRRATTTTTSAPRLRVKPCLAVCQRVEQDCPYFLPGDRAPSYPTQYAGEPTFLCLDPNIEETGEQLRKSNYGAPDCCYAHCGPSGGSLCAQCRGAPPEQEQPYAAPCGAQPLLPPLSAAPAQSSSPRTAPPLALLSLSLPLLLSAYNNLVYNTPRNKDARYSMTLIIVDWIMGIVTCTRL